MQTRACPHCGASVPLSDRFCGECGRPVDSAPASATPVVPASPPAAAPPPYSVPPATYAPPGAAATPRKGGPLRIALIAGGALALCAVLVCGGLYIAGVLIPTSPTPGPTATEVVVVEPLATPAGVPTRLIGPTRLPEPTPRPQADILFEDDFSDPEAGKWDIASDQDTDVAVVEEHFEISIYTPNLAVWSTNGKTAADAVYAVETTWLSGPEEYTAGLIFRENDADYYAFRVNTLGQYSFFLHQSDEWITIVDWTESDAVQLGEGVTNLLVVTATGDTFVLEINGTKVDTAVESTLNRGEYGMIASVYADADATVGFDNFVVRKLPVP